MSKLDDIDFIKKLDKSDMHHLITHLPEQLFWSLDLKINGEGFETNPSNVVICGMGGSAISGDIVKVLFGDKIPITVVKDYTVPSFVPNDTPPTVPSFVPNDTPHTVQTHLCCPSESLYIIVSYSGNTIEAIECLNQAMKITNNIVAITSGGKIKEIVNGKYPCIDLPAGFPPRAAIGYLFFSILKVLEAYQLIPGHTREIKHLIANLMRKAGPLCFKTEKEMNLAKSSAETIFPKIPIIYSSNPTLAPVAYRWKCQINENAKIPAFCNTFPEMFHNEIEAWEKKEFTERFIPIFLRSFHDKKNYSDMTRLFQSMLEKKNIDYLEFYGDTSKPPLCSEASGGGREENTHFLHGMPCSSDEERAKSGDHRLQDIFTLIYLGDMISFYLAILNNVDPTEINNINYLKNKLT